MTIARLATTLTLLLGIPMLASSASAAESPEVRKARAALTKVEKSPPKCGSPACADAKKLAVNKAKWNVSWAKKSPSERAAWKKRQAERRGKMTTAQRKAANERWKAHLQRSKEVAEACDESAALEKEGLAATPPASQEVAGVTPAAVPATTPAAPAPAATRAPPAASATSVATQRWASTRPVINTGEAVDPSTVVTRCGGCPPGARCIPCACTVEGKVKMLEIRAQFRDKTMKSMVTHGMSPERAAREADLTNRKLFAFSEMSDQEHARYERGQLSADSEEFENIAIVGRHNFERHLRDARLAWRALKDRREQVAKAAAGDDVSMR